MRKRDARTSESDIRLMTLQLLSSLPYLDEETCAAAKKKNIVFTNVHRAALDFSLSPLEHPILVKELMGFSREHLYEEFMLKFDVKGFKRCSHTLNEYSISGKEQCREKKRDGMEIRALSLRYPLLRLSLFRKIIGWTRFVKILMSSTSTGKSQLHVG